MPQDTETSGYVYILEVCDIDLPVCKIGRTSKTPSARCAEINRSSTGDFLWQVAFAFCVKQHQSFEKLAHLKLAPYRQKNREFFNVEASVAYKAIQSILDTHPEIKMANTEDIYIRSTKKAAHEAKKSPPVTVRPRHSEHAETLSLFTELANCKGRSFGQLNKPFFGMSDGNTGVQWNILIFSETGEMRLGVNLEGIQYDDWPITNFLLAESENPQINEVRDQVLDAEEIFLRLARDAWQAASRPFIVEEFIGPNNIALKDINANIWQAMLSEALTCLSEEKGYRGRAKQEVTLKKQPKRGDRKREMWVSPHLTIWTPISASGDKRTHFEVAFNRLRPVYDWVSRASQSRTTGT